MTRHLFIVVVLAGTIATWALGSFRPAWTEPLKLGAAAPEITGGGGCARSACSCGVEPGRTYCCQACARARDESADCACGHVGCTRRAY